LFVATGGDIDTRFVCNGKLKEPERDTSADPCYQNFVVGTESSLVEQCPVSGQSRQRHGRRFLKRQMPRLLEDILFGNGDILGKCSIVGITKNAERVTLYNRVWTPLEAWINNNFRSDEQGISIVSDILNDATAIRSQGDPFIWFCLS